MHTNFHDYNHHVAICISLSLKCLKFYFQHFPKILPITLILFSYLNLYCSFFSSCFNFQFITFKFISIIISILTEVFYPHLSLNHLITNRYKHAAEPRESFYIQIQSLLAVLKNLLYSDLLGNGMIYHACISMCLCLQSLYMHTRMIKIKNSNGK